MALTERLAVLLTPDEKHEVRRRAKALGMDVNEYVRTVLTGDVDDAKLEEWLERTKDAAEQSIAAIDETVAFVNASNARIAEVEGLGGSVSRSSHSSVFDLGDSGGSDIARHEDAMIGEAVAARRPRSGK